MFSNGKKICFAFFSMGGITLSIIPLTLLYVVWQLTVILRMQNEDELGHYAGRHMKGNEDE